MSDKIINFTGSTTLDCDVEDILIKAASWDMRVCAVIGLDNNGDLSFGGSTCDAGEIILMLELAKKFIIDNRFDRVN